MAADYADVRDRRQALTAEEVTLKQRAMQLMTQHHKTVYRRNGITITIVPGEAKIKVKVKPADDDTPTTDDDENDDDDTTTEDDATEDDTDTTGRDEAVRS